MIKNCVSELWGRDVQHRNPRTSAYVRSTVRKLSLRALLKVQGASSWVQTLLTKTVQND